MCVPLQAETVELLTVEGQYSLNEWAAVCASKCVPGAMFEEELL